MFREGKLCYMLASKPMMIAQYLGLDNVENYTGHGLRRKSAANQFEGGDLLTLKQMDHHLLPSLH